MSYQTVLTDDGQDDGFLGIDAGDGPRGRNGQFTLRDGYLDNPSLTLSVSGHDNGELAFNIVQDSTARPVATPATFGQIDETAFVAGVYADGTMPLYAFGAWNNDKPATYTGGFTNTAKWGAPTAHTPGGTISYYFTPSSNWSTTEQQFLSAGLSLWSDVANISFAETSDASAAQIVFTRGSDGGAATNPHMTDPGGGGQTGGTILLTLTKATISIDTSVTGFGPIDGSFTTDGGYPIMTFLHEEGHSIGLGHAGPYNGTVNESQQQFSPYDTRLWTIMSYIEPRTTSAEFFSQYPVTGTNWGIGPSGFHSDPTGLMPLDILAAQALYGAPTSTPLSGGQTFGFHCNVAGPSAMFFDFTQNTVPILTLFDMGTNNTLDLSGFNSSSTINLNPGTFSSCDGMTNNLGIAFNTAIDTVIGGGGNDNITGNSDGDTINGGAGDDTLRGGAGSDMLNGGAGTDTARFSGAPGNYFISQNADGSYSVLSIGATDTLTNIELASFDGTGQTLALAQFQAQEFDALRYIASYPDLLKGFGANALAGAQHYFQYGIAEGRDPNLFDPLRYIASYSDLLKGFGTNVVAAETHYIQYGFFEGRDPTLFDPLRYIASYSDLLKGFGTNVVAAETHYIQHGFFEGRDPNLFDPLQYIASYSDLLKGFGTNIVAGELHYIQYGFFEGRNATGFDPVAYLLSNPDLLHGYGFNVTAAETHYIKYGFYEGRAENGLFGNEQSSHNLAVGTPVSSSLETVGDRDWFSATLTAGMTYKIDLAGQGSGVGTLSDAYLRVYGADGTLIGQDNDSGPGADSEFSFTATASGLYYLVAGSNNDALSGTYRLSVVQTGSSNLAITASDPAVVGFDGQGNPTVGAGDTAAGLDKFVFKGGEGIVVIAGFDPGVGSGEVVDLHGHGVSSFDALQPLMSQVAADTVITFDAENQIILQHVSLAQLHQADFLFG